LSGFNPTRISFRSHEQSHNNKISPHAINHSHRGNLLVSADFWPVASSRGLLSDSQFLNHRLEFSGLRKDILMSSNLQSITKNQEWLTPQDAARQIGVSPSLIYKMIRIGQLQASRVGLKLIRIKVTDLNAIYRPASKTVGEKL
jgi:excisionase family DNA binding protein